MNVLCVSATTDPTAAGGAVEGEVREAGVVEIQAIDPCAVNQDAKSIGIVRSCLAASDVETCTAPRRDSPASGLRKKGEG
jgi:stage V sporulation protein SpoVS